MLRRFRLRHPSHESRFTGNPRCGSAPMPGWTVWPADHDIWINNEYIFKKGELIVARIVLTS